MHILRPEDGAGGEEEAVHSEQSLQVCDVLPLTLFCLMQLEDGAGEEEKAVCRGRHFQARCSQVQQ